MKSKHFYKAHQIKVCTVCIYSYLFYQDGSVNVLELSVVSNTLTIMFCYFFVCYLLLVPAV